jgi:signal transduction histidine kinase
MQCHYWRDKTMERFTLFLKGVRNWTDSLVPARVFSDGRSLRKARLLVLFYLASASFLIVFALLYWYVDYTLGVWACLYGAAVVPVLLFVFNRTGSFTATSIVFDANAILMFSMLIYGTGGIDSPIVPWLAIIPASGFVFQGWQRGLAMSLVCLLEIVLLTILETQGVQLPMRYDQQHTLLLKFVVQIGLVAYIFMVLMIYQMSRERTIRQLDKLNAALENSKAEVEAQREALAESNVHIANINTNLERLVASRTANLQQAKKELDTFLYEAAHALRRPVARIMGLVAILRDQPENSPASEAMHNHLDTSTALMDQILHKLIMVSELDMREVKREIIDLGTLENKLEERAAQIQYQRVTLTIGDNLRMEMVTDPYLLELALGNVLDNALQYSIASERRPQVEISFLEGVDAWIIQVSDNGIGIPPSEMGRVTEMFFRATAKVTGGGLGLYVSQKAMDRLGGTLHLDSKLGEWTVVELRVPFGEIG